MSKCILKNVQIVITRPEKQAQCMSELCRTYGAEPIMVPMINIRPRALSEADQSKLCHISNADWLIFTSTNAVEFAMPLIKPYLTKTKDSIQVASVGNKTATKLAKYGIDKVITPETECSSEGLLEHPNLKDVESNKIMIFTGLAGRKVLMEKLISRGAEVSLFEVYQRVAEDKVNKELVRQLQRHKIDVVFISSGEIFQNFVALYQDYITLNPDMIFVVASQRIADMAEEFGISETSLIVAQSAHDDMMLKALIDWREGEVL